MVSWLPTTLHQGVPRVSYLVGSALTPSRFLLCFCYLQEAWHATVTGVRHTMPQAALTTLGGGSFFSGAIWRPKKMKENNFTEFLRETETTLGARDSWP